MKREIQFLLAWLPIITTVTILAGLIYVGVQQSYRQLANDPQIQLSEDFANNLADGQKPSSLIPTAKVDLASSLDPYIIIYDDNGKVLASMADLNGQTPPIPKGVFDYTKSHNQDRLTWQPAKGVRSAIVVTRYTSSGQSGYVVAGRSLREIEVREDQLLKLVVAAWFVGLVLTFIETLVAIKVSALLERR